MSECYFGVITTADEGEALVSTHVPNRQRLRHYFGASNSDNRREFHNAESFLKYSPNLKVVRVVNRDIANKRLDFVDNNPPLKSSIGNFYNSEVADIASVMPYDRLAFIEKFPRTREDISVAICSDDIAWDQEISNEKINQVLSMTVDTPPTEPKNNDMYIVPETATGDWGGHSGQYAIWLDDNDSWNFVSVIYNDTIYVVDENKEYIYNSPDWISQSLYYSRFGHIKYKNESAYRVVYNESIQNSFGKIRKWNQMFISKPDFSIGGVCVLIFALNETGDRFSLVEKFSTTYDKLESIDSRFVYIRVGNTNSNLMKLSGGSSQAKINTYSYSIADSRFEHNYDTDLAPTVADYEAAVEVMIADDSVRLICDLEIKLNKVYWDR
jgi:hypothetical protein